MNMLVPFSGSQKPNVATQMGERNDMQNDLDLIADIREGLPAMQRRRSVYLPQYARESRDEYHRRVAAAPWRAEFADALQSLASKPFAKPVTLAKGASEKIRTIAEDIDGRGNNLHVFAREVLIEAIANGVHAIMVDFPRGTYRNLAEEKLANPKPYWLHLPIRDIIACYTEMRHGREVVTHLRTRECHVERDGYGERTVERVRVYEPGLWELWEQNKNNAEYELIDGGQWFGGKSDEVFVAFLFTGKRTGTIRVKPPLRDLADMQVELYRALSRQDEVLTYAGSPMLGTGLAKDKDGADVTVGPKTVLFGQGGDGAGSPPWGYVQPDAENIKEIREQVASVIEDFRHLAMQPAVSRSGDVTATASAINSAKAHSTLEWWALSLKDTLEQAFMFTEKWIGETKPTSVIVHTDFGVGAQGNEEARTLLGAQKNNVISKKTVRSEYQRRGILGAEFDPEKEDHQIAEEQEGLEPNVGNGIEPLTNPRNGAVIDFRERA